MLDVILERKPWVEDATALLDAIAKGRTGAYRRPHRHYYMTARFRLQRFPWALSWGLPASFALFVVLASLVGGYLESRIQAHQVEEAALRNLRRQMTLIQGRIEHLLAAANLAQVQQILADLGSDPDFHSGLLADEQGTVLASNPRRWIGQAAGAVIAGDRPIASLFERIRQRRLPEIATAPGGCCIAVVYPVVLVVEPGTLRPSRVGVLYVKRELTSELHAVRRWTWLRVGIATAVLAAFALAFALLGRSLITRRARRIVGVAERYAAGDREARARFHGQDEIGRIGRAFDAMADRLSEAQRRVEANEARLQAIFDVEPECVKLLTKEGVLIDINRSGLRIIEADSRDAVVGQSVVPLVAEPYREAFQDLLAAVCRGETKQMEFEIVGLKGTRHWMDSRAAPFQDPVTGGGVVLTVTRDITERKRAEERLRESEGRFRQLAENITEVFWLTDPAKNEMLYISPAYEKIWGRSAQSLYEAPRAWLDAIHPEDRERVLQAAITQQAAGTYDETYRITQPDGAERWIHDRAFPVRVADGTIYRIAGVAEDITESKRAEEQLRESEERFAAFMNNSPATAFVKDAGGRLLYINPTFERAFDFKERDWRGKTDFELWDEETARQLRSNDLAILGSGQPLPVEETVQQKDGEHQWITFKFPFRDRQGDLYLGGMGIDITERKQAEQQARYLAFHDPLTGLPNRTLALDRLRGVLAQAERERREAAVLFVDLDRFKDINDTLGHSLGDRLLQQVSARLRPTLREGDTVARLGGDEFLILLPRIEASEDAARVAQKLIETISAPYTVDAHELHVGASVGVGLYPRDGTDAETLIKHADAALYHAKNSGRNQYKFFDRSLDARAHERLAVTNQLRRTIERGEIEVHYQPQIDATSGAVVGLEALARWDHPERGYVSPGVFVPIAEDSGLIVTLGQAVLRQACAAAAECRRARLGSPRMSVNLSARQLRHPDLVENMATVLAECGHTPADLELELTESSVMEDPGVAAERMTQLAELGVRIALDDFGTGYSSLAYLKRFRIDCLKIDQSFVRDLPGDLEDAAIVRAIAAMARALDLDLLAEGVETEAQRDFLLAQGCRHMQGYLFCHPLPLDELLAWLRKHDSGVIDRRA